MNGSTTSLGDIQNAIASFDFASLLPFLERHTATPHAADEFVRQMRAADDLVLKRVAKKQRDKRDAFFSAIIDFLNERGLTAHVDDLRQLGRVIETFERCFAIVLDRLDAEAISKKSGEFQAAAILQVAAREYDLLQNTMRSQQIGVDGMVHANFRLVLDSQTDVDPDAVVASIVRVVSNTLVMLAYQKKWFAGPHDAVRLPSFDWVEESAAYQAMPHAKLASVWEMLDRAQSLARYANAEFKVEQLAIAGTATAAPDTTISVTPAADDLPDLIANTRFMDRFTQHFAELMEDPKRRGVQPRVYPGLKRQVPLPPKAVFSFAEALARIIHEAMSWTRIECRWDGFWSRCGCALACARHRLGILSF